eukprot:TRINITY_DN16068_c0_g1_i1.p1 TRINITY_DN16068_c0_g1~~TRINITY_DN16068_c0_g1_i1.p1  ORF type:complete len:123 (-),score=7.00 TRINITY_DN16068_c0_g1_i1:176-544(-)
MHQTIRSCMWTNTHSISQTVFTACPSPHKTGTAGGDVQHFEDSVVLLWQSDIQNPLRRIFLEEIASSCLLARHIPARFSLCLFGAGKSWVEDHQIKRRGCQWGRAKPGSRYSGASAQLYRYH